jgi:Putative adhesin
MKNAIYYGCAMLVLLAAACLLPVSATAQGRSEGSFERTLNVGGTVDLEVSTGSGSIDIRRGSSNRVEIRGKIRAGNNWSWWRSSRDAEDVVRYLESNPPIEQFGQTIRIGRIPDRELQNVSISYEIVVPGQSNLRANTGSGSQTIQGIDGRVEARTGSGSMTLRDIRGPLEGGTGSGSIDVSGFRGDLRMHTGSGRIQVQGDPTGRWDLQTGSGSIDLDLPPNAGFDLNAHTGSGGIDVGYPMTVQGRIGDRHNVTGKVGAGGPPLFLRTGSGGIRIQ